jgi:uncharacterized membrane protein
MTQRPDPVQPGGERPGGPYKPSLRPTNPATLVVAALGMGVLAWLCMRRFFGDIPDLNWLPGLTLAGLAVVEVVAAQTTRARVERRPGSGRINPLLVARYAVLAKASSLGGAIFAGTYAGVTLWALVERDQLAVAEKNLPPAIAGLVGGLALTAAALLLERACRVPPPPEDKDNPNGGGPPGASHR